ncbi:MAG TPA: RHS repeat-associated core domain-containing protein, partial [Pirellula sp.]|nr:RHS repeat-associated core domain-containing protein [Pirellula sp.]
EYNLTGKVIRTFTSLDHQVKYELDPNGRVTKLTTAKDQSLSFERDARGLEIGREMPGEMRMEQRFDSMGRLLDQRVGKKGYREFATSPGSVPSRISPNTEKIQRNYSYDQDGLLLSIKDAQWGNTEYGYDPVERLLSAFRDKGVSESFEFDANDNITLMQKQNGAPSESALTYGPGNRIQQRGNTIYEHDLDGRLTKKIEDANSDQQQVWEYYWDAQGQMKGLLRPDGGEWTYKYDAFGRRTAKIGPTSANRFLWNGDIIIHEINLDQRIASWVIKPGNFEPLAKVQAGAMFNVINDHLGTPRKLLDGQGKVVWDSTFSVWGSSEQEIVSTDIECPIRFQGQWFDEESGLHYNRFRYYDPRSARYIGPDPIGISGD